MIDQVPWTDAFALLDWVEHNLTQVTPLVLERLLGHFGFVEAGEIPSQTSVRCVLWKHRKAELDPRFANYRILVYHCETVPEQRVKLALALIEEARMFERHITD